MTDHSPREPGRAARGIATFLCVIVIVVAPLALSIRNLSAVLASPERVIDAFESSLVDGGALSLAVVEAVAQEEGEDENGFSLRQGLAYLSPEDKATLGDRLFPDDWLRSQIRSNIERFYAWMETGGAAPALIVDLGSRKGDWLAGDVNQIVTTVMGSWPACTAENVGQILGATLSGNLDKLVICRPGEPIEGLLESIVATGIKTALMQAPDQLTLVDAGRQLGAERIERGRVQWNQVRGVATWSWWVPVALMLMVSLLVIRGWHSLCVWWGWPLLLCGAISIVLVLAGWALGPTIWRSALPADGLADLLGKTLEALARQAGTMQAQQAGILSAAGALLLLVDRMLRGRGRPRDRASGSPPSGRPAGMFG